MSGPARRAGARPPAAASAVPDVLGPDLPVVFCGINPGFASDAAKAHFANPRNDFWRLLQASGFTSRLYEPSEQFEVLREGIGLTNAALRTTRGSGDLRRADFAGRRRPARAVGARAAAGLDRLRRQGGISRRVQRAPQARRAEAPVGADTAVRAALDLTCECGRPVGRTTALVPQAAREREEAQRKPREPLRLGAGSSTLIAREAGKK